MSTRRVAILGLMVVCLGGLAIAQDEELPLSNWGAPPYWKPTVQQRVKGDPGGAMVAHAQGMQAQAEALPSSPLPFVAIEPCRIVDTRDPAPDGFHAPNLSDGEARTFYLPESPDCPGLPKAPGAYSLNIQFRPISQLSYLTAYPTGTTMPLVSTMTAGPAAWVQNAAVVPAGTGGAIDIYCQYAGRVVIDINGYYGPAGVVTSLNTLAGDLTLAEGSNVTITPSAGTLTIAATGGPGGELPAGGAGQTLRSDGASWLASSTLTNDGTDVGVGARLTLPNTTASVGQVTLGGAPFLHNYAQPGTTGRNTFVGESAGNFTMGGAGASEGSYNVGIGFESLSSNTAGRWNAAIGYFSLHTNTTGYGNTASGRNSLASNTSGSSNTATGSDTLQLNTTASKNTAVGSGALFAQSYDNAGTPWDSLNTAIGYHALYSNQPNSAGHGLRNTALGALALDANTTGASNVAIGVEALTANTT